jgi:hypothetical protein
MAAFAFENANKVWGRVNIALVNASPATKKVFQALKLHLSTQKGNPDLQFLPFINTSIDDAGGQVLATGAARILAIWGVKPATATDVYLVAFDDATDDAGAGTDGRVVLPFLESVAAPNEREEEVFISPRGVVLAAGLVMKAYTDFDGTTDSTDTDCPSGFVLVKGA